MKKLFTLLCCAVASSVASNAQITLSQSSYGSVSFGTDSFRLITKGNTVNAMPFATNAFWDLTAASYEPNFNTVVSATDTNWNFPAAGFKSNMVSRMSTIGQFNMNAQMFGSITSASYARHGVEVEKKTYPIGSFTMVNTDSIWIPYQNVIFTNPETVINFPATYGSTWSSAYTAAMNFTITATPLFLSNAPGVRKLMVSRVDSVKGWGKLRVKNKFGASTDSMNVLQVKTVTVTTDSLLISGSPAPAALMSALGLVQGQKDTAVSIQYYRVNEIHPLAEVIYTPFTSNVKLVTVHQMRLQVPAAVSTVSSENGVSIYPNPVTERSLTIAIRNTDLEWKYELINMMGQTVAGSSISGGIHTISINQNLPAGIYYLRVLSNANDVIIRAIDVIK